MNHANIYCKTLDQLPRDEAINALHQALMQFNAIDRGVENVDNKPIRQTIEGLLTKAGHVGFPIKTDATAAQSDGEADRPQTSRSPRIRP